jgi:hypothetical protein
MNSTEYYLYNSKMKNYKFNIKIVRKIPIEVIADSKEHAKEMIIDLMKNSDFRNIKLECTQLNNYKRSIIKDLFN